MTFRAALLIVSLVWEMPAFAKKMHGEEVILVAQSPAAHFMMLSSSNCSLPWGGTIPAQETVTAYSSNLPTTLCSSSTETRTCASNGTLSGSYQYQSCTSGCSSTPWGPVSSGFSGTAYSATNPAGSCYSYSELRSCNNGTMNGSYANTSCMSVILSSGSGSSMNVTGPGSPAYGSNVVFTFQNTGSSSTGTMSVSLSNTTNFEVVSSTCNGVTMASGATCTVTVRPKATADGSLSGNLTLNW